MPFGTMSAEQGLLFIITQKLLPSLHNNTSNRKSLSSRIGALLLSIFPVSGRFKTVRLGCE